MTHRVRVWDLPTRLFHALLAAGLVGMVVTGQLGIMEWHFRLGYAMITLVLFRLVWGMVGGHWSRFSQFVYGPASVFGYLKGLGKPEHSVGHSPLGALSVWGLFAILSLQLATGLFSDDEISNAGPLVRFATGEWVGRLTDYHTDIGKFLLLAWVVLHIGAIVRYRLRGDRQMLNAMWHGDKELDLDLPSSRDSALTRALALLLVATIALGVWWTVGAVSQIG